MAKFGRFEFGKEKPTEEYSGGFMKLENKAFVCIFDGKPDFFELLSPRLVHVIHLEKGQSVREMSATAK